MRRDPLDPPGGDYYRVLPEGRVENYDGVSIRVAGSAQGLDLNRNFPSNWRQEHEQFGAGPYPTSEPEVRAVVDFIAKHPNIGGGTSLHTFSGVLLRPFGHLPDEKMPAEDLWTYQKLGKTGEQLTGYPAISIWHEFQYYPGEFITGAFDWIYEHLGMFMWTIEIWNPKKEAGIDNDEWIHWFRDHPIEDDLKMYDWAQRVAPGEGHVEWKPFDHPQLGRVEIGGWNRVAVFSNPPPALREKEVARFPKWLLSLALVSPQARTARGRGHAGRRRHVARAARRAEQRLAAELRQQDGGEAQGGARRPRGDRAARGRGTRERQAARGTRRARRLGLHAHRRVVLAEPHADRRPRARRLDRARAGRDRDRAGGVARPRRARSRPGSCWARDHRRPPAPGREIGVRPAPRSRRP